MLGRVSQELSALLEAREQYENYAKVIKEHLADINERIAALTEPFVQKAFSKADKTDGTVRFALENESYKAVVDKRVSWDSDKLQSIAGSIPFEDAQRLFKVEYSMTETAFKSVNDDKLAAALIAARTVKYGTPKITKAD